MSVRVIAEINPFKSEPIETNVTSKSIEEIIVSLNTRFALSQARVCKNGEIIKDFSVIAQDGDTLWIKFIPHGSTQEAGAGMKIGGWIMTGLGIAAMFIPGIGGFIGAALIGCGLSMALGGQVLMNINIPTLNDREKPENDPSIRGGKNKARLQGRIPVLFGQHRIYPDLAANPHTEVIGNNQYFTQLFCGGYKDCEIDLTSFKLGETSLIELSQTRNINNILSGTDNIIRMEILQNGETSNLYPNCVNENIFNKPLQNQIDNDGILISGEIIQTTPNNTDKINIDIFFYNGLGRYDNDGNLLSSSVEVCAYYKPANSPDSFYELLGFFNNDTNVITGAELRTRRYQVTSLNLIPGQYTIKIVRLTADSDDSNIIDQVYIGSIRSFKSIKPIRQELQNNLTIIALRVMATARLNGVIEDFNYIATAKLPVYSKSGTGPLSWIELSKTRNPAAMLLYVLQGKPAQQEVSSDDIDWRELETFYKWCEDYNYNCDAYISEALTISEITRMIGSTARADILRIDSKISVIQDIEKSAPVQLFTPKNSKNYSITMLKGDIPDAVSYRFIDEQAGYSNNELQIYNTPDGNKASEPETNQKNDIWGITNSAQVRRIGMYNLACLKNRPFVHTIEVDIEYLLCNKGDWIQYAGDIALTGSIQGRIRAILKDEQTEQCIGIRLDEPVEINHDNHYAVRLRLSDGKIVLKDIYKVENQFDIFFEEPVSSNMINAQNIYAFGIRGKEIIDLKINDIQPQADFCATLVCVEYSPEIFNVDKPDFILPEFVNKITPVSGAIDSGIIGETALSNYITYHDSDEKPERPTGNGTDNGWYHLINSQSKWQSRKTSRNILEGEWSSPSRTSYKVINEAISTRPTFKEIVSGFTAEGAVMIPIQLTLTAAGGFRSISLSWMKQINLSNLKEYELQVSENSVNWFAPRFDGQGPHDAPWRGAADSVFTLAATFIVHANIPSAGTADEPTGRILFYRVRQRTMQDVVSEWSNIVGTQTKLTDTGDYATNSISANSLKVAELFGIFAKLSESLIVDPRYGLSFENNEWSDGDTRAILNARQIAFQFFSEAVWLTMARLGLEGVEATQLFSKDKLFITNADMLSRRARGYDVGSPLPSDNSRVAHMDVWEELLFSWEGNFVLDQNREKFFKLTGTGSLEGEAEGIPLFLKAIAPYATESRALHGNFRLLNTFDVSNAWTLDFWLFYFWNENQVIFSVGNESEKIQLVIQNDEPYLNDEPTDNVWLNDEPTDGSWLNEIRKAHVKIVHIYQGSYDEIELDENILKQGKWYHIGIIADGVTLKMIINEKILTWNSREQVIPITVDINSTSGAIDGENSLMMIDEMMWDPTSALSIDVFNRNTALRRPWGKLDDQFPWAIINVDNPAYFKTNIFQSQDFKNEVLAIINGG
ncbi:MAG: host specificity factor TipJ family phage tail protein [Treponema sp.]|nr:host specificity factor TipJ family phage tail protein [Treponema sp.]